MIRVKTQPGNRNAYKLRLLNASHAAQREISIGACQHPRERAACRRNLLAFINRYGAHKFSLGLSADHKHELRQMQRCVLQGGLKVIAAPRGDGKTTRAEWAALWAALYGHRRFIVIFANAASLAADILRGIKAEVEGNELLEADFPEVCTPIRRLEGQPMRAIGQTLNGERTRISISGTTLVLPTVAGSPASGVVVQARGITAKVLGLKVRGVRPDFLFIDDPQDEELSRNPGRIEERERLITGTLLGLAGPGERITACAQVTVRRKDDLAERLLSRERHPEWQGERRAMVTTWPPEKTHKELWLGEYARLRREGLSEGDEGRAATAYYQEHRAEMDAGMVVSWDARKEKDELSALQSAYNLLIDRGREVFFSEYQNDPVEAHPSLYEISEDTVLSRLSHLPAGTVPERTVSMTGFVDVNAAGLHWCAVAWCDELAGYIAAYGRHPDRGVLWDQQRSGGLTEDQAIYSGLAHIVPVLLGSEWRRKDSGATAKVDRLLVDCAGARQALVFRSINAMPQFAGRLFAGRGISSRHYRQTKVLGRPGDNVHVTEWAGYGRPILLNSDHWRQWAQKAFLLPPGAPGSLCLPGTERGAHVAFAQHVCAEQLREILVGDTFTAYNWAMQPGRENHWLDALVGCCAAASLLGGAVGFKGNASPGRRRPVARVTYDEN